MADDGNREQERRAALEKSAAAAREAARNRPAVPIAPPADAAEAAAPPATAATPATASTRQEAERSTAAESEKPTGPAVLSCEGIWQRYPGPKGRHLTVLNDIHLRVPEHDFITVVGPSGCGKSTLLRLILGSEPPWKGTVRANGEIVDHPDRQRGIVFQRYSLFPHLTVLDNVIFGLELDGTWLLQKWLTWPWYARTHRKRHIEKAMSYLKAVHLEEHAGKYPHQLSGGMQQRVAIAQAKIMRPEILLMDEPFGALDPGTREALQDTLLETFQGDRVTIFFVTHDLDEAAYLGNRLLVLSQFFRNDDESEAVGAKIVMDVPTPRCPTTGAKHSGEFQEFIAHVRRQGFDPAHRQRIDEFELSAARLAG